jgi:hypothetical protein
MSPAHHYYIRIAPTAYWYCVIIIKVLFHNISTTFPHGHNRVQTARPAIAFRLRYLTMPHPLSTQYARLATKLQTKIDFSVTEGDSPFVPPLFVVCSLFVVDIALSLSLSSRVSDCSTWNVSRFVELHSAVCTLCCVVLCCVQSHAALSLPLSLSLSLSLIAFGHAIAHSTSRSIDIGISLSLAIYLLYAFIVPFSLAWYV